MGDNVAGDTMGEKTAEETMELYEMLRANSQQKSVRERRIGVNKVQTSNDMEAQLIELTRQVAFLNSQAQPNSEVCGVCGTVGHGANVCLSSLFESEEVNYMETNQPRQHYDLYSNTYNPGWRSHLNFSS